MRFSEERMTFKKKVNTKKGVKPVKKIIRFIRLFNSLESRLFRYSLSYGLLLAVFPGLLSFVMLYQFSILNLDSLLDFVVMYLPKELIDPFIQYLLIKEIPSLISAVFSFGAAVLVASQSFYSFLLVSARHEKISMPSWILRIRSILLFLFFMISLALIGILWMVFPFERMIFLFGALFAVLSLFYMRLSFERRNFLFAVPGAFFTALAMLLTGILFFWIISSFTSYQSIYGPLSSLVVLFLSVYVISSEIYFGYLINLALAQELDGLEE